MIHEYEGSFQGKPLSGLAIYGYHLDRGRYEMAWVDTFHSGTSILFSTGEGGGGGDAGPGPYSVLTSYEAPSGPPWGWRTEITVPEPDKLIITHYNIPPGSEALKAVETVYARRRPASST